MMNSVNVFFLSFCFFFSIAGCKNSVGSSSSTTTAPEQKTTSILEFDPTGQYVTDSYSKRKEGYDWISVLVQEISKNSVSISVRSRADKKNPSCTFDCKAEKITDSTYQSTVEGKIILFSFTKESISISTANLEDDALLYFFCGGGATIKGKYSKIYESIDSTQIDSRIFQKFLTLQNISFDISTKKVKYGQVLTIKPFGLSVDNKKVELAIDGIVTGAEIEDLNSDGFPEVLVYTQSAGSGSYGDVIGYSVNKGKSISRISFPKISENKNANKGYRGHDEFSVLETTLAHRFPVYAEGNTNAQATGKIRQIEYQLKDGEASRFFVVKKITELDKN